MKRIFVLLISLLMILSVSRSVQAAVSDVVVVPDALTVVKGVDDPEFKITVTRTGGASPNTAFSIVENAEIAEVSAFSPASVSLTGQTYEATSDLTINTSTLSEGVYVFKVKAADSNSSATSDEVTLTVLGTPIEIEWPTATITYGQALSASPLTNGSANVEGAFTYNDPTIIPGAAGVYSAAVTFTPANTQYAPIDGYANITVNKANATIVVDGWSDIYDGLEKGASGTAKGVDGLELEGLNLGARFTNVPGGTAYWTFIDVTGNYNDDSGSVGIVISKANATINVSGSTDTYDGQEKGASGTAKGVDGLELLGLNLGARFTNVPGGTANWTFTDVTGNYNDKSGSVAITINKANATINVNGWSGTYDGQEKGASGTAIGVDGLELLGLNLGARFTNVPGGTANWTFTDVTGNYNDDSGSVAITINKANATIAVIGWSGTYDGQDKGASGTVKGVDGLELSGLDLGARFTNVPGGTANWTFTDVTGNYNDKSGSEAIVINKANATIVVVGWSGIYDGQEKGASGTAKGVDDLELSGLNLGALFTNVPGGTAYWTFTDVTGNYNDDSGSEAIVITRASLTITANNQTKLFGGTFDFNGSEFAIVGLVNGDSVSSVSLTSGGAHPDASVGNYAILASNAVGEGLENYNITYVEGVMEVRYGLSELLQPSASFVEIDGETYLYCFKTGRVIPLRWQYTNASGEVVDSSDLELIVMLKSLDDGTEYDLEKYTSGKTILSYNASNMTWQLNWQTKGFAPGLYELRIICPRTGQADTFYIKLE